MTKNLALIACFALTGACRTSAESGGSSPAEPSKEVSTKPKETVAHIPVGKFKSGSRMGEPGRDPAFEPVESEVELGPFRMDLEPAKKPDGSLYLGASFEEAESYCSSKSGRLCSDLEWQRACRGPASDRYPGGREPSKDGTSAFDVKAMATHVEWTRSTFGDGSTAKGQKVVVGALTSEPPESRRCARRQPLPKDAGSEVSFRCCYGAPNARSTLEPTLGEAYKEEPLDLGELKKLLAEDPHTKDIAENAALFKAEAVETVFHRGPGESQGFTLTTSALRWNPSAGANYLLVAGRSGDKTSFVVALRDEGDKKVVAGSFVMKNEPGPVVLAYAPSIRPRVHFSTCFGCPGETGKVLFREPEELVFLQP